MLTNLEKGDTVAIRDENGQTKTVTVLSVKIDYEKPGSFVRFDYICYSEPSPMRRTAYPKELVSIIKKNTVPKIDPLAQRPGDMRTPQKAVIIDGKTYVEKTQGITQGVPINEAVNTQVHEAAKAPAKPVTSRIKKSTDKSVK